MKRLALAVAALVSEAVVFFGGPHEPKEVVAPAQPPPLSYFRGNEFDIGIFATYLTGTNGGQTRTTDFASGDVVTISGSGNPHGWGGGMDFTYFLTWKHLGFRFQGVAMN